MRDNGKIHIGTSGYSYADWLGNFYPQFCSSRDFLKFYSSKFKTVEIDATFYGIPSARTVEQWRRVTPEEFLFSAKFPRTVTHEGDLASRIDASNRFLETISHLDRKLGPLLLQFPYSFNPADHHDLLEKLLANLPKDFKYALEIRNRKWLGSDFYGRLASKNVALCLIDHPWMPRKTEFTSDFAYIRFLGDRKKIESDFSFIRLDREEELSWWRELIEEFSRERGEVYAYFNNHYSGHSPTTARRLKELLAECNGHSRQI